MKPPRFARQSFPKAKPPRLAEGDLGGGLLNENSQNAQSPALAKLEKEFTENGGQWCEFSLKDLFEVNSSKEIFHANQIKEIHAQEKENTYPYVVRSTLNNGIRGYIAQDKECLNPANTLSFAQDTFSVFYQEKPYFTGNKVKILVPKFTGFNKKLALFIVSIYQKALAHLTWGTGSTTQSIQDTKIQLPAHKNGEIAFDFMQSYIKELENERVLELENEQKRELKAYLQVTGLKDYELNEDEKAALKAFESLENSHQKSPSPCGFGGGLFNENLKWREFKIGGKNGLFEIVGTKSLDENKIKFIDEGVNFVGRVNENNGIKGKIAKQNFEPNAKNTITATVIGQYKYVKLQREPYYCSQNINKLTPKFAFDKYVMYFFVTHIQKFVAKYNGQQGGYKLPELQNHGIFIPTKNGEIATKQIIEKS